MNSYITVPAGANAEIEVKKSRFIAALYPAADEAAALAFLESERKKYYDAKHHCSAYVLFSSGDGTGQKTADRGPEPPALREIIHSSDDGEPSGTAGKPILEVLQGAKLYNVICVVTRYFGGTLLGTGGLVRAYTDAAREAVKASKPVTMRLRERFTLRFDYSFTGKADHLLGKNGCVRENAEYGQDVIYTCTVRAEQAAKLYAELTEASAGQAEISRGEVDFYPEKMVN